MISDMRMGKTFCLQRRETMNEERTCLTCSRFSENGFCRLLTALEVEECLRKGRLARWSSKYNEQYEMALEELDPE